MAGNVYAYNIAAVKTKKSGGKGNVDADPDAGSGGGRKVVDWELACNMSDMMLFFTNLFGDLRGLHDRKGNGSYIMA